MPSYVVRPGDTLSQLSARYGAPVSSITGYSSGNPNLIRVGEKLTIPNSSPVNKPNASTATGPAYFPPPKVQPQPSFSSPQQVSSASFSSPKTTPKSSPINASIVPKASFAPIPQKPTPQKSWAQDQVQKISTTFVPKTYAAEADAVSSPGFTHGTPDWVKPMIKRAAEKYNIPTALLSALLKQESGFNPHARSSVGAQGIAQFMPETARGMGIDPSDPESAIMGAAQYLRKSWDRFGKPELALAAYNAGGGAVNQYGGIPPYKETQNYVKNIMAMAGEVHDSANGPYLQTLADLKKQATTIPKANSKNTIDTGIFPHPYPQLASPIPQNEMVTSQLSPEDLAIVQIRRARPNLSLSDQQLRELYAKYGNRLLEEL